LNLLNVSITSGRIKWKTVVALTGENKNIYSSLLGRCQERRKLEKPDVTVIDFKRITDPF